MGIGTDAGRNPQVDLLRVGSFNESFKPVKVAQIVDDDCSDAELYRALKIEITLRVAVHLDLLCGYSPSQRDRQLTGRGDVAAKPLFSEESADRGARERLRGKDKFEVVALRGERGLQAAGAGTHVVLGDDVGGGAELTSQLDDITAADLEPSKLVDPAPYRVDVLKWLRFSHRRASCHSAQAT